MFCYQCQETAGNKGCSVKGVCGKNESTANLQDLLIYALKGYASVIEKAGMIEKVDETDGNIFTESLFMTITNANFDDDRFYEKIAEITTVKTDFAKANKIDLASSGEAESYIFSMDSVAEMTAKAGILSIENEDLRSLTELMIYGLKGVAAYAHHAQVLGFSDAEIYKFVIEALALSLKNNTSYVLVGAVLQSGDIAV